MKDIPDCVSNCPIMFDDFDEDAAIAICEDCYLNEDDYAELTSHSDLFCMAMDYLARHDVGLQDAESEYSERQKSAIVFVSHEIKRQQNEKMERERDKAERKR